MEINELYSREQLAEINRKNRIWKAVLLCFIAVAFITCVVLCVMTNTANAETMEATVIGISIGAGCIAIYLAINVVLVAKRRAAHMENLMEEEREILCGLCEVTKDYVNIPGSVEIVKIKIGDKRVNLDAELLRRFNCGGKNVRVELCHNYIVSYEVTA